jgi:hypothetical protein
MQNKGELVGQLELIRYPLQSRQVGNATKDKIRFMSDNLCLMPILAEDLIEVKLVPAQDQPNVTDLRLQLECKFWHSDGHEHIKILFELDDKIIESVREGIKELLERNKHGNSHPL